MTINILKTAKNNFSNQYYRKTRVLPGVIYRSICLNIFIMNFTIEENYL